MEHMATVYEDILIRGIGEERIYGRVSGSIEQ